MGPGPKKQRRREIPRLDPGGTQTTSYQNTPAGALTAQHFGIGGGGEGSEFSSELKIGSFS